MAVLFFPVADSVSNSSAIHHVSGGARGAHHAQSHFGISHVPACCCAIHVVLNQVARCVERQQRDASQVSSARNWGSNL